MEKKFCHTVSKHTISAPRVLAILCTIRIFSFLMPQIMDFDLKNWVLKNVCKIKINNITSFTKSTIKQWQYLNRDFNKEFDRNRSDCVVTRILWCI